MNDIVIAGSATIDCIVQGSERTYKRGGVVVYGGITLCREGLEVGLCCNISARDRYLLKRLEENGAQLYSLDSPSTTTFVNVVDGDARRQQMPYAASPITCQQIRDLCERKEKKRVLLGPLHPLDIDRDALMWLGERDIDISIDMQGYTRVLCSGEMHPGVAPDVLLALRCARRIKVAREELNLLLAFEEIDISELIERYGLEEVIVTDGSHGGCVYSENRAEWAYDAAEVDLVVDPTGAGDVFFAAYLARRLYAAESIEWAARYAAHLAAKQIRGEFITDEELAI